MQPKSVSTKAVLKWTYHFLWQRLILLVCAFLSSLPPFSIDAKAEGNAGVGFALYHILQRARLSEQSEFLYHCSSFNRSPKEVNEVWRSDLYLIRLPLDQDEQNFSIFTRTTEGLSCKRENAQIILERHPCLEGQLEEALNKAEVYREEIQNSYAEIQAIHSPINKMSPKKFYYSVKIQSIDPQFPYIDPTLWNYHWLIPDQLFYSTDNTCPFKFVFEHGARLDFGREEPILFHDL